MGTKKENAALLQEKLGLTINHEASTPLAATLQGWADRVAAETDAVKREILTSQLEDELDIQIPGDSTPEQLQDWLTRAFEDPDAVRAEVAGPVGRAEPELYVTVSPGIAAYGGTYTDPDQAEDARVIGEEPVAVIRTAAVALGLKNGSLVEAAD